MVTDRISLNLIYFYLNNFQANQGEIDNIQISARPYSREAIKTISFSNLTELRAFIEIEAPLLVDFSDIQCFPLNLYELKSFNVTIDLGDSSTSKNYIWNNDRVFKANTNNIHNANMDILNKQYVPEFLEVLNEFNNFILSEYILLQYTYIECGYIEVFFGVSMEKLEELYKKYKNK